MNKTFNINLGGYPFTIDEDAFAELDQYLISLNTYFGDSEGCDEIVGDIENRIAELFKEKLKKRKIVNLKDVQQVMDMMGRPEQFDDMNTTNSSNNSQKAFDIKTGKRLFRDPEDQVISGVCSGLSAYLGIQDPVWMRLAFVVLVFGAGVSIVPYIVLWMVVPEAQTAGDRLSMRGEAANVSNIAKTVEEEMQNLGKKITQFSEGFKRKKQ